MQTVGEHLVDVAVLEVGAQPPEQPLAGGSAGPGPSPPRGAQVASAARRQNSTLRGNSRDSSRKSTHVGCGSIDERYTLRYASDADADFSVAIQWWKSSSAIVASTRRAG